MATNPTMEDEATAVYVARLLQPLGVEAMRIAMDVPEGSSRFTSPETRKCSH